MKKRASNAPERRPLVDYDGLIRGIGELLESARRATVRVANSFMTVTYWEVGRRIVEFEQGGKKRAEYGDELLKRLAVDLTPRLGRGFGVVNLSQMKRLYLFWGVDRILQTLSEKSHGVSLATNFLPTVSGDSSNPAGLIADADNSMPNLHRFALRDLAIAFPLPWSHYVRLLSVKSDEARQLYETEALRGGWSVRQLDRQINSLFYERTALSKNKVAILKKGTRSQPGDVITADEAIRDPLVLEFLNLRDEYSETDLESALIHHLETFLLELGGDFAFVGRQRRRSGSHYTPRSLTEPIVRTTLRPILQNLGDRPTPEQILDLKICDLAMGSGAFLVETCRQLGDELVRAWHVHGQVPKIPPDEDEVLHARRLIAQRCLYGVDKNPLAVDLAKLSLWLATLAKAHPFTFLDHALRCGDSLVGLTRDQIAAFHWSLESRLQPDSRPEEKSSLKAGLQRSVFGDPIAERMRTVTEYRQRILAARDDKPYEQLRQELDVADEALSLARLAGDCVIAAYFSAGKDRERVAKLDTLARQLVKYVGPESRIEDRQPLTEAVTSLHSADHPIQPFHWQIEFPEVFTVDAKGKPTGGFDAIVGNPPFAGRTTLSEGSRDGYIEWLKTIHEESHGNADLVAHFFRRAFNLLRRQACFGLIATNTIGQGDTRSTGLRWICTHGGTIYAARKRLKWPGQAAVVVSVVHVCRGTMTGPFLLDGREVPIISAYLFHAGGHEDPEKLTANERKSFQGCVVVGLGFTFDDADTDGVANSIAMMRELIAKEPRNAERIFPYVGGEEVNDSPTHAHRRYVINFGEMSEEECRQWPDLMRVVEDRVKPERVLRGHGGGADKRRRAETWWRFARTAIDLYDTIRGLNRILVCPIISNKLSFVFLPASFVFSHKLMVFPFENWIPFGVLQSRVHEEWARTFTSTMKDDLNYSNTDCFETFPFPAGVLEHAAGGSPPTDNRQLTTLQALETAGREYYEFRAALMVRNDEGLTKTYNRFHSPDETLPDIRKLRELHAAMDRAVLDAYGWTDLVPTCEFLLDYEEEEDEDEPPQGRSSGRSRRKPWRYRWPDDFRDEVLARLLELNKQRAEQERLAGLTAAATSDGSNVRKQAPGGSKSRKPRSGKGQTKLPSV